MARRGTQQSMNGVARVLIISDKPRKISQARKVLLDEGKKRGGKLEIMTCRDIESAKDFLTYYLNGILLHLPAEKASDIMPSLKRLRRIYSGRIALVNDDPSVEPYTWGRVGGVDFYCKNVEEAGKFADLLLAPRLGKGKTALLLEAGGVLGGFMELGAVRALYDFGISEFDIYIGISAGSFVAACAANQIPFRMMLERRGIEWAQVYYPNFGEIFSKTASFVPNLFRGVSRFWGRSNNDIPFYLSSFFASSLLSTKRITSFLETVLDEAQGTNSFKELRDRGRELYIIATDLDTTERRTFGEEDDLATPISEAVGASIAIPITYSPARIDGRDYIDGAICNAANLDVAVEHGADLVICVNPLVPFISKRPGLLRNMGPLGIMEQSYRSILHQILLRKIERYKADYPTVTTILIEPDPTDPTMFHNPLHASKKLMDMALVHGYRSTRKAIERQFDFLQKSFLYHGVEIYREHVDEKLEETEGARLSEKSRKVITGK